MGHPGPVVVDAEDCISRSARYQVLPFCSKWSRLFSRPRASLFQIRDRWLPEAMVGQDWAFHGLELVIPGVDSLGAMPADQDVRSN